MLTLGAFSAWITCEGIPLREYCVSVDATVNKVTCWISSDPGRNFTLHWRDTGSGSYTSAHISLDGFVVPGRFLNGFGESQRSGYRTGANTERPFKFAEHFSACSGDDLDAGNIKLMIRRVIINGQRPANAYQHLPEPSTNVSNRYVSYGEERQTYVQFHQTWNVVPCDGNLPDLSFVFRCRPQEFLLSRGIIHLENVIAIPPAVIRAGAESRRVAAAMGVNLERTGPEPSENTSGGGSGVIRRARVQRGTALEVEQLSPGESILDLNIDPELLRR